MMRAIDEDFSIGTTPSASELEQLPALGFRSIVDLRMDGEVGGMTRDEEQSIADRLGLRLLAIAIPARTFPGERMDEFRREVAALPRRVLVHCTKGARADLFTNVHLGLEVGDSDEAILARIESCGFIDEPQLYRQGILDYLTRGREPYSHLAQVIW